ncbi:MAG: aquaporin, partial [Lysobacterales bacterium]
MTSNDIVRRCVAEFVGTAFLLAIIVGSGTMGDHLSGGNGALALLANSLSVGFGLAVLILVFGPVSGAHFNPVITLVEAWQNGMQRRLAPGYLLAQFSGALAGVLLAHAMFLEKAGFSLSRNPRSGPGMWLSEFIATFGLLAVVAGCARYRPGAAPAAVGAYIASAFWFTPSTSFANPAVTVARAFTDTFTGIQPQDVAGF